MVRIGGEKMRRWFLVLAALLLLGGLALATAAYAKEIKGRVETSRGTIFFSWSGQIYSLAVSSAAVVGL